MAPPTYDLEIDQGDDEKIDISVVTPAGVPADLSGCTMWFWIKTSPGKDDADSLLSKSIGTGITFVSAPGGTALVTIQHIDTSTFTPSQTGRKLAWSLQVKDGGGLISTLAKGTIVVNRDLIQAIV